MPFINIAFAESRNIHTHLKLVETVFTSANISNNSLPKCFVSPSYSLVQVFERSFISIRFSSGLANWLSSLFIITSNILLSLIQSYQIA